MDMEDWDKVKTIENGSYMITSWKNCAPQETGRDKNSKQKAYDVQDDGTRFSQNLNTDGKLIWRHADLLFFSQKISLIISNHLRKRTKKTKKLYE